MPRPRASPPGVDQAMEWRMRCDPGLLPLECRDTVGARDMLAAASATLEGWEVRDSIRAHRRCAAHAMSELEDPERALVELESS